MKQGAHGNWTRRGFVGTLASAVAALIGGLRSRLSQAATIESSPIKDGTVASVLGGAAPGPQATLNGRLLREIAAVVLPDELSPTQKDAAVDAFLSWTRGYRAGAERDHGYGFTRLRTTPPDPAPSYVDDLGHIEALARAELAGGFAALPKDQKRALIARVVDEAAPQQRTLGGVPDDTHIVVALLDHFYRGSDATDLCYRAAIHRNTCRDLFGHIEAPERSKS